MGTPISPLEEKDRKRLDSIVDQMIQNNESEENIRFVVDDFKQKYSQKKSPVGNASVNGSPISVSPYGIQQGNFSVNDVSRKPPEEDVDVNSLPSTSTVKLGATDARVGGDKYFNNQDIGKALKSIGKGAALGVGTGLANIPKGIAIAAREINLGGEYDGKKTEDLATYKAGKWIEETTRDLVGDLTPEEQQNFGVQLAQGFGNMATLAAGGLGARALGASELLTTAAIGATQQGTAEYENAIQAGATPDQAAKVFWINAAIGTTDSWPVMKAFRSVDKYTGGLATGALAKKIASTVGGRVTSDLVSGFVNEALQEAGQQFLTNLTAKNTYDATRGLFDDVGRSGALGGTIGATMRGVVSGIRELRAARNLTPEENLELDKTEQFAKEKIQEDDKLNQGEKPEPSVATEAQSEIPKSDQQIKTPETNEPQEENLQTPPQEKAQPQEEQKVDVLTKAVDEGRVTGIYADLVKQGKGEDVLKDIAQQAQNIGNDGTKLTDGKDAEIRKATIDQFGEDVVNAAIEKYPAQQAPKEQLPEATEQKIPEGGLQIDDDVGVVEWSKVGKTKILFDRKNKKFTYQTPTGRESSPKQAKRAAVKITPKYFKTWWREMATENQKEQFKVMGEDLLDLLDKTRHYEYRDDLETFLMRMIKDVKFHPSILKDLTDVPKSKWTSEENDRTKRFNLDTYVKDHIGLEEGGLLSEEGFHGYSEQDIMNEIKSIIQKYPNGIRQKDINDRIKEDNPLHKLEQLEDDFIELTGLDINKAFEIYGEEKNSLDKRQAEVQETSKTSGQQKSGEEKIEPERSVPTEDAQGTTADKTKKQGTEAGKPPIEPPKEEPPVAVVPPTEGGEGTGITHAQTAETRTKFGFEEYEKKPETFEEWDKQASERIANGDMPKLIQKLKEGKTPSEVEQRMMGKYIAELGRKAEENPSDENLNNLHEAIVLSDIVGGREVGKSLVSRKGTFLPDDSLAGFFEAERMNNKDAPLTEKQKETVKKEWEDLEKAKNEYNAYVFQKESELGAREAQARIAEEAGKSATRKKGTRKTDKEFADERKQIITDIKEKLKKARGETQATILPFAKELIAISPDVAKLVRNLVDNGVTKLAEVVDRVHEILKEDIKDISKQDVIDLIAGNYNEKKKTRNQLARDLYELRTEAQLVNKLDALLRGEEPKVEKKKIQRNQEIAKLREQIKSIQEFDKEVAAQKEAKLDAAGKKELSKDLSKAEKEIDKKETDKKKAAELESKQFDKEVKFRTPEEKALASIKTRLNTEIQKTEDQIKRGDYSKPEKKPVIKLDKEGNALRDKLIKLQQQRDARMLLQQRQNEGSKEKALRYVAEVFNIPRTLMTIGDFSGLLRQNLFFSVGHPAMTAKALPGMFKSFVSQKVYDRWFADLKETPRYETIQKSRLAIADSLNHDLSKREEDFMSTLAEKIPVIGRDLQIGEKGKIPGLNIVKGSERSYTMLLNKMRVDMFNYFADQMEARGLTADNSPKEYKAMAEYINNATGRSDFGENLNRVAPILNSVFFSPRLVASRINMLTYWAQPRFWKTLPKEARIDYFRNWASLLAVGGTIMALAGLAGADVEDDPRSSDFGKIKAGDTRWDLWGGAQPYVRTFAQVATGKRKSTNSGKIYDLDGDDIFGENRMGVVTDFFRNKLAPVPGAAVDVLSGRTSIGDKIVYQWGDAEDKEISIDQYVKQRLLPMTITGTQEAIQHDGLKTLFTVGIPSTFGVGTQTYSQTPTKERPVKIYSKDKVREATPEEIIKIKTEGEKLYNQELKKAEQNKGWGFNKYGELTTDDDAIKKKGDYSKLNEEDKKELQSRLKTSATSKAKKLIKY